MKNVVTDWRKRVRNSLNKEDKFYFNGNGKLYIANTFVINNLRIFRLFINRNKKKRIRASGFL